MCSGQAWKAWKACQACQAGPATIASATLLFLLVANLSPLARWILQPLSELSRSNGRTGSRHGTLPSLCSATVTTTDMGVFFFFFFLLCTRELIPCCCPCLLGRQIVHMLSYCAPGIFNQGSLTPPASRLRSPSI